MKLILVWQINHFDFQDFAPGHEVSQRDLSVSLYFDFRFVLICRFVDFMILGLFLVLEVIVGFLRFYLVNQNCHLLTTSYGLDFIFYVDYFLFAYINCLKYVNLEYGCNNSPLAQSVERGANHAKVTCSSIIRPDFTFYVDYYLFFSSLRY